MTAAARCSHAHIADPCATLAQAAEGFATHAPWTLTDKLRDCATEEREVLPHVKHRQSRHLSTRDLQPASRAVPPRDRFAAMQHQPARKRERQTQRFKSARHSQRFFPAHGRIHNHFQPRRCCLTADQRRAACDAAFRTWRELANVASAA